MHLVETVPRRQVIAALFGQQHSQEGEVLPTIEWEKREDQESTSDDVNMFPDYIICIPIIIWEIASHLKPW